MNDDNLILLFSFILYWITFASLLLKSRNRKRTLTIHLAIHLIYSSYFLYELFCSPQGNGTALAPWLYLLLALWLHWVINLVQLVYSLIKIEQDKSIE